MWSIVKLGCARVIAVLVVLLVTPSTVRRAVAQTCGADTTSVVIGDQRIGVCYVAHEAGEGPVFGQAIEFSDRWLVQYDTLWRPGIVLTIPVPIELAGIDLVPGSYGLYAVPSSFEWTVIVTPDMQAYAGGGAYADALRTRETGRALVRSSSLGDRVGRLAVRGEATGTASADLVVEWDRTQVRVPIRLTEGRGALTCELRGAVDRLAQRASPPDSVDFQLAGARARVCYGRPSARGRRVFGGIVPYDDMWRTGANEPTVLHLPLAADIAGIAVAPGDYALMTVPSPTGWVLVVNGATNRWGRLTPLESGSRSQYTDAVRAQGVGRVMIPSAQAAEHVEALTISAEQAGSGVELVLAWERTRVRIPIRPR